METVRAFGESSHHSRHSIPSHVLEEASNASRSLDHTERSKIRIEDKTKFVSQYSLASITLVDLVAEVDKIWRELQTQVASLQEVRNSVQWRLVAPSKPSDKVTEVKSVLKVISDDFEGLSSVDAKIAFLVQKDRAVTPSMVKRVMELEVVCLLSQLTTTKLEAFTETKELDTLYTFFKESVPDLFALHIGDENTFIQRVDQIIKSYVDTVDSSLWADYLNEIDTCQSEEQKRRKDAFIEGYKQHRSPKVEGAEKIKIQARAELYLRMFTVCSHLAKMPKEECPSICTWREPVLAFLVEAIKQQLQPAVSKRVIPKVSLIGGEVVEVEERELNDADLQVFKEKPDPAYGFWKNAPGMGKWYNLGWYPNTGLLGAKIESEVGRPLGGLLLALKTRLTDFCQANAGLVDEPLAKDIVHYKRCLELLEKRCDIHVKTICTTARDDLTEPLFDYTYGIAWGFHEAKALIELLERCADDFKSKVFEAMQAIEVHYNHAKTNLPAAGLFASGAKMQEVKAIAEKMPKTKQQTLIDALFKRTAAVLEEIHVQQDPQALELTESEQEVPGIVLGRQLVKGEGPFATSVLHYLLKRIQKYLFFPSPAHDMELELVLYVLKDRFNDQYNQSRFVEYLEKVLSAYETTYTKAHKRWPALLDQAVSIAELAFKAARIDRNLMAYVEAWHKLCECINETGGDSADAIHKVLETWLTKAASTHHYPKLHFDVAKADIENLKQKVDKPAEFFAHLLKIDVNKDQAFAACMLRLVGATLFAKDVHEQSLAHEILASIFARDEYAEMLDGLPDDFRMLFTQSIVDKVHVCSENGNTCLKLTKREEGLLLHPDGPIAQCFNAVFITPEMTKIQMVIFKLRKWQNLTADGNVFIEQKIRDTFNPEIGDDWSSSYNILANGNPVNHLLETTINAERDNLL